MKHISILYFLLFFSLSIFAQQLSIEEEQFVDSIMNANYKPNGPGAVLLIAKKGKPIYRKAFGLANLEFNIPNKPEFIFRIGSMTKQFIAICMLKLEQEGKINLQDDILKYLPGYNSHGRHISIENLLNHTSGIASYTEKSDFDLKAIEYQSQDAMMNYIMTDSLLFEPSTNWSYSNSGYLLAGIIIEKVTGKSLIENLHQNIFIPLKMFNTSIGSYDKTVANLVNGYESAGSGKYKPARYMSWSWPFGSGSIITTVDDLLKWDNALYTENIISKDWRDKAWISYILPNGQATNYGFGWATSSYRGLQFLTHGGGINGFVSDAIRIPSEQIYAVIISNTTSVGTNPGFPEIVFKIAGKPISKPTPIKLDKKELEKYTGVYEMTRQGGSLSNNSTDEKLYRYVTFKNDTLFLQSTGSSKTPLINVGKDLFTIKNDNRNYLFNHNDKEMISALEIYSEPVQYGPSELSPKTDIPLPKEKKPVTLDAAKLESLVGKYEFGGGFFMQITVVGNKIYAHATGQEIDEIFAEDETNFFSKKIAAEIEFLKIGDIVTGMVINQGGRYEARKID